VTGDNSGRFEHVILVDANVLLFAADRASLFHEAAARWLTDRLNSPARIGFPWQSRRVPGVRESKT
jgi:hypothetical protein